jgi:hypothetical protein
MQNYRILLFLPLLALCSTLRGQDLGRLWLAGYDEFPGVSGYGQVQIRVLDDTVLVEPAALAFNFESTVAVATDPAGDLLFYTNGCAVSDRQHQIMPGGEGLNPGDITGRVCPQKGYIVPQGAMTLPAPGHAERHVLLHLGASYDPARKLRLGPLYYTEIDMNLRNGLGDVVSKNNVLLAGDLGAFTAVRHGNGRDWWVLAPEFGGEVWHAFLLGPDGFFALPPQFLPLPNRPCEKHIGTAASLQGDRVAHWGDCKVTVLDFDRCSGTLGGILELPAPTHWIPGGGVAFSPSGRYLYATSQNVLFRADLQPEPPETTRLDTVRFSYDPLKKSILVVPGNTFHVLLNGPDGRIYGNTPSRAGHLHVLHNPDSKSISTSALDFRARGLPLPVANVRTLPHLPHYRLTALPDSPCDTLGIVGVAEVPPDLEFRVSPNPARHSLLVECPGCPDGAPLRAALHNIQGSQVRTVVHPGPVLRMDTHGLPPGVYALQLWQGGHYAGTKRVVLTD